MRSLFHAATTVALLAPVAAQQITLPCTQADCISQSGTDTWNDNRLRAYTYSGSGERLDGFMSFDMSLLPSGATVTGLTLRTYHEEGFGNPASDPQVRIYRSSNDSWAWGVDDLHPGLNEILSPIHSGSFPTGDAIPYDWALDVNAANWALDIADGELTLAMRNENAAHSYVYFYGHVGPDPGPELIVDYNDGGNCDRIDVGGFDSSRGRPLSTTGNLGYDTVRAALADGVNFGPNGTVCCPITLAAETALVDAAYLSGIDTFFAGDGAGSVSAAEGAALAAFHANGGNIIVVGDAGSNLNMANSILAAIGSGMSMGASGCANLATDGVISGGNYVADGPFGPLAGGTFATSFTAGISGGTPVVVCTSTGTVNMAVEAASGGSGTLTAIGDAGWFDLFTNATGSLFNPNNVLTAQNAFAVRCGGGGGGGGPVLHCDPANVHSGGTYVTLAGSSLSGPGVLHLEATSGPVNQFGYFLVSLGVVDPGAPISNGVLCLTAPIGRYAPAAGGVFNSIGQFNGGGVLMNLVGTSTVGSGYDVFDTLPTPPGGAIGGGTVYFQLWYRDAQRSNFSNVLQFQ